MKAWIRQNRIGLVVAFVFVVVVVLVLLIRPLCSKPVPQHVTPVPPETVAIYHWDIDTTIRLVVDRDSLLKLERKIQALTDEKESWAYQATVLDQAIVTIDSEWAARFDSMAGVVSVAYQRGKITTIQYQRPMYVRSSEYRCWRNTFTIRTTTGGGVVIVTRRIPWDFGVYAGARAEWTAGQLSESRLPIPEPEIYAGIGARRDAGQLKVDGFYSVSSGLGVRLGVEFRKDF